MPSKDKVRIQVYLDKELHSMLMYKWESKGRKNHHGGRERLSSFVSRLLRYGIVHYVGLDGNLGDVKDSGFDFD